MAYQGFENAKQTWKEYQTKIKKQALLEERSQPKFQALRTQYEGKVA